MAVTIQGVSSLKAKLSVLDPITRVAVSLAVKKAGLLVEGSAKSLAPVDTGALRGSIHTTGISTSTGAEATVGTALEYAPYVEFGTSRMSAQPYLHPALQKNKGKIRSLIIDAVAKAHRGL